MMSLSVKTLVKIRPIDVTAFLVVVANSFRGIISFWNKSNKFFEQFVSAFQPLCLSVHPVITEWYSSWYGRHWYSRWWLWYRYNDNDHDDNIDSSDDNNNSKKDSNNNNDIDDKDNDKDNE